MSRWSPGPHDFEGPLTDADLEEIGPKLEELTRLEGWGILQRLLGTLINRGREAGFEDKDNIDHWIGYVEGVKHAQTAVPEIVQKLKEQLRRDRIIKGKKRAAYIENADSSF